MLRPRRFEQEVDPGPVQIQARKVHFDATTAVLADAAARGNLPPYLREPLRALEPLAAQLAALITAARSGSARDDRTGG